MVLPFWKGMVLSLRGVQGCFRCPVGAAWVPFCVAGSGEIQEAQILFLLAKRVRVDAKRGVGAGVPELRRYERETLCGSSLTTYLRRY